MSGPGYQTYTLRKKPSVGFGIAISGGTDQMVPGQTGAITISDVVAGGPAVGKLEIGDKLIMVQNNSCVGMTRADCVNLMKSAGNTISISVVRQPKAQQPPSQRSGNPYNNRNEHHQRAVQQQQQNYQNHSRSDYSEEEEDPEYIHKQPIMDQQQHHQQIDNSRQHQNNNNFNNTFQTQPTQSGVTGLTNATQVTLEPNAKRDYNSQGPEGTMTLDVNQPKPSALTLERPRNNPGAKFGIQFGNQLIVKNVLQNSIADQYSDQLRPGDQILEINGQDVTHMSSNDARGLAASKGNRLELLVRKQGGMTVTVPISGSNLDQISERLHRLNNTNSQMGGNNVDEFQGNNNNDITLPRTFDNPDKREIIFYKTKKSLGIRLEGGNNAGIFIGNIQPNSPADNQGFQVGDRILEVNGKNFKYLTHEEAIMDLMSIKENMQVSIVVKASRDAFDKVKESNIRDQFYIRTHFKFDGDSKEPQWNTTFNKGEVFLVYDTLYKGQLGFWLASRIDARNRQSHKGVIPSKLRAERIKMIQDQRLEKVRGRHMNKLMSRLNRGMGGNTASKPMKTQAYSTAGPKFDPYERVVLREASFRRPVVLFGPVADIARDILCRESHLDFQLAKEQAPAGGDMPGRKGVVRIQTINEIIANDKHAVLDVTPNAVEKLNYAQLYPICIYLKTLDKTRVKNIRDRFSTQKKNPKKQIDRSVKLDRSYRHVFTDIIEIDHYGSGKEWTDELFRRIHDQQHLLVWISEKCETFDREGLDAKDELDNNEDKYSYVSAPASDYSVTTVGTEMAHQLEDADEENNKDENEQQAAKNMHYNTNPRPKERKHSPMNRPMQMANENDGRPFNESDMFQDDGFKPYNSQQQNQNNNTSYNNPVVQHHQPVQHQGYNQGPPPQQLQHHAQSYEPVRHVGKPTTTYYPPPPDDENGPGRINYNRPQEENYNKVINEYNQNPNSRVPPHHQPVENRHNQAKQLVNRGVQYEEQQPIREYHQVPNEESFHNNVRPSYYQQEEPQNTFNRPTYQPPSPEKTSYMSPNNYTKQLPEEPVPNNESTNRFDPQAILEKQREKNATSYGDPGKYAGRAPLGNNTQSNVPVRPFQSSWNPNPKPIKDPKPQSGLVADRLAKFNGGAPPANYPQAHRNSPPPPQDYAPPTNDHQQMMSPPHDRHNSSNSKKDVVATARGVFDYNGGVLSSLETGVSLVIPEGAIPYGQQQEIYFKVCHDENTLPTPANPMSGEKLMSPMVMCGPHGLKFEVPIELRLPHRPERDPQEMNLTASQPDEDSVSILIDHF